MRHSPNSLCCQILNTASCFSSQYSTN